MPSVEQITASPVQTVGIFAILKAEHRTVLALMEKILNHDTEAEREATFETLYRALHPHAKGEEETLYARLMAVEPSREIALEGVQEHRVVATLLAELRAMTTHGDTWLAKFKVLKENVEHHVEEEQDEMFAKARQVLSQAEDKVIAKAYEAARDRHLAAIGRK